MNDTQFNELLSYVKIVALNSTALLFQQSRQTPLTPDEIEFCQVSLLRTAQQLQSGVGIEPPFAWPPSFGRSDK